MAPCGRSTLTHLIVEGAIRPSHHNNMLPSLHSRGAIHTQSSSALSVLCCAQQLPSEILYGPCWVWNAGGMAVSCLYDTWESNNKVLTNGQTTIPRCLAGWCLQLCCVEWRGQRRGSFRPFTVANKGYCFPARESTNFLTYSIVLCSVYEMRRSVLKYVVANACTHISVSGVKVQLSHS